MAIGEDVYCTLVLNDAYLPGAAVLAHSLRDCGARRKLACIVTPDTLRDSSLQELRSLYNYVIPIESIGNPNPANLYLMNRLDLLFAFTKIHLWRLTQFRKIIYIDSDVVALRAPDELFEIQDAFAAAPDVGWPDAFNSGVMVLTPDLGEYAALRRLAESGDSFDGADQGLLNQYFEHRPWRRINFTYNTTPSANYQYEPAYRYYKRDISLVHFIGSKKPWQQDRIAKESPGSYQELLSKWWAVYDRYYQVSINDYISGLREPPHTFERENWKHEQINRQHDYYATGYPVETTQPATLPEHSEPPPSYPMPIGAPSKKSTAAENIHPPTIEHDRSVGPTVEPQVFSAPQVQWDPAHEAPPAHSKPEAASLVVETYEFNTDPKPFQPPKSYPEPPKNVWTTAPGKPSKTVEKLKPIFPWEERDVPRPTRRFIEDETPASPSAPEPDPTGAREVEANLEPKIEPPTPTIQINDDTPWQAFASNRNAWDDMTAIDDYVRALTAFQKNRGKVQVVQSNVPSLDAGATAMSILSPTNEPDPDDLIQTIGKRRESLLVTDFPTEVERPSLPVTPAPRRRDTFWGEERDERGELPAAEGVPNQADWDPSAQLEELRRSTLIKPEDLNLPPAKNLPTRDMPASAAMIHDEEWIEPNVPVSTSAQSKVEASQSAAYNLARLPISASAAARRESGEATTYASEKDASQHSITDTLDSGRNSSFRSDISQSAEYSDQSFESTSAGATRTPLQRSGYSDELITTITPGFGTTPGTETTPSTAATAVGTTPAIGTALQPSGNGEEEVTAGARWANQRGSGFSNSQSSTSTINQRGSSVNDSQSSTSTINQGGSGFSDSQSSASTINQRGSGFSDSQSWTSTTNQRGSGFSDSQSSTSTINQRGSGFSDGQSSTSATTAQRIRAFESSVRNASALPISVAGQDRRESLERTYDGTESESVGLGLLSGGGPSETMSIPPIGGRDSPRSLEEYRNSMAAHSQNLLRSVSPPTVTSPPAILSTREQDTANVRSAFESSQLSGGSSSIVDSRQSSSSTRPFIWQGEHGSSSSHASRYTTATTSSTGSFHSSKSSRAVTGSTTEQSNSSQTSSRQELTNANTSYNAAMTSPPSAIASGPSTTAMFTTPGFRVTSDTAADELDMREQARRQSEDLEEDGGDEDGGVGLLGP